MEFTTIDNPFRSVCSDASVVLPKSSSQKTENTNLPLLIKDTVTISPRARQLSEAGGHLPASQQEGKIQSPTMGHVPDLGILLQPEKVDLTQLRTTNAQGTTIEAGQIRSNAENSYQGAVYGITMTKANGSQLSLEVTDDVRIQESSDGSIFVYYKTLEKTRVYAKDGSMSEFSGNTLNQDINTVFINITGKRVDIGDTGGTVFNFSHDASIYGGSGNDTIIIANGVSTHIDTGDGNDTILGNFVSGSSIKMGNGSNIIHIDEADNSKFSIGNGNNTIDINKSNNSKLSFGNGNNKINIEESSNSRFSLKDGSSTINIDKVFNSQFSIGNGENNIRIGVFGDSSNIQIGDGKNTIQFNTFVYGSEFHIGNGDNNIKMNTIKSREANFNPSFDSLMDIGNGNNTIKLGELSNYSKINIGNGSNSVSVDAMYDSSFLNFGDGNNGLGIRSMNGSSGIRLGNGHNDVRVFEMNHHSSLYAGDGNNIIDIIKANDSSRISLGKGYNLIHIVKASDEASLLIRSGIFQKWEKINESSSTTKDDENLKQWRLERVENDLPIAS